MKHINENMTVREFLYLAYKLGVPIEHIAVIYVSEELEDIIDDELGFYFMFGYNKDKTGGYTDGDCELITYRWGQPSAFIKADLTSNIELAGYCECEPTDEGYIERYECCGVDCDWTQPTVSVEIELPDGIIFEFNKRWQGQAKELWNTIDYLEREVLDIVN